MTKPVRIDLRKDLPKARKVLPALLARIEDQKCEYTAPCVVGAMIPPSRRAFLEVGVSTGSMRGSTNIGDLIDAGLAVVPVGQKRDLVSLQKAYDSGEEKTFLRTFARVEKKYAGEQS